jgi:hypothetical protein
MATSTDGINWTGQSISGVSKATSLASNGIVTILATPNKLVSSIGSLTDFTNVYNSVSSITVVAYGFGKTLTTGRFISFYDNGNSIIHSVDGINWSTIASSSFLPSAIPVITNIKGITWFYDKFIACGTNNGSGVSIIYSYDGTVWNIISNSTSIILNGYGISTSCTMIPLPINSSMILDKNNSNLEFTSEFNQEGYNDISFKVKSTELFI